MDDNDHIVTLTNVRHDPDKNKVEREINNAALLDKKLDPKIQDAIGRSLKAHYDTLINAPVPDKFLVLLAELEAKEQNNGR